MAEFISTQAQLAAARTNQDAAQLAALHAAARARRAQAELDLATRQTSSARGQKQNLSQLVAAAKQASADQDAANQALRDARERVNQAVMDFAEFRIPQRNVSQLSDRSPFVLFP